MHLLLSFRKDSSFFCRDARIATRELQYRNRTLSVRVMCIKFCNFHAYKTQFEELAEQFIPSYPTLISSILISLHHPLVPMFPVSMKLLSNTKWIATKGKVARQSKNIGQAARTSTTRLRGSSESGGSSSRPRILKDDQGEDEMYVIISCVHRVPLFSRQLYSNPLTMSPKSRKSGQSKRSADS